MESLKGNVIHGENIGQKQGYPTANLSRRVLVNKKISKGVYIAETIYNNKKYKSIFIIGVPGEKKQKAGKVEIFFLNFKGNLYGKKITIRLIKKIRPLVYSKDHSKLLDRIKKDIIVAKNYFKSDK
ncbi:MAG: riboflavin kinase [bacterium]|nr:riboflavin kinase [bacterium]